MMSSQSHICVHQEQPEGQAEQRLGMINPFYFGAVLWTVALIAYGLSWSDLCRPLDPMLFWLLLLLIMSFLILGLVFRDVFYVSSKNVFDSRRMKRLTALICAVMAAGMVYQRSIPLVNVIQGQAYNTTDVGTPLVGTIFTALALYQSFRLSFTYQITKSKMALTQLGVIFAVLVLAVQRQNIMVCIAGILFSIWTCRKRLGQASIFRQLRLFLVLVIVAMAVLFAFGAIGNARYGIWSWNDSSMIAALGHMNNRWPVGLPKEYFWTYIYLVSPIANLNNTILSVMPQNDSLLLFWLLVPSSIGKYFIPSGLSPFLIQPTLTVCTSYVNSYLIGGYVGMIFFMVFQQLLIAVITAFAACEQGSARFAALFAVIYYVGLTIFDNPSSYLITSYLGFIAAVHSLWSASRNRRRLSADHE